MTDPLERSEHSIGAYLANESGGRAPPLRPTCQGCPARLTDTEIEDYGNRCAECMRRAKMRIDLSDPQCLKPGAIIQMRPRKQTDNG